MKMTIFNHDIPDEFTSKAAPIEAIVGQLPPEAEAGDIVTALEPLGSLGVRAFFLTGGDGIEILENVGTPLGRFFGPDRTKPLDLLRNGDTLVGIFGVQEGEQSAVIDAITAVGVRVLYRFGRWTYS